MAFFIVPGVRIIEAAGQDFAHWIYSLLFTIYESRP
jgi:hypothetical protein